MIRIHRKLTTSTNNFSLLQKFPGHLYNLAIGYAMDSIQIPFLVSLLNDWQVTRHGRLVDTDWGVWTFLAVGGFLTPLSTDNSCHGGFLTPLCFCHLS